LDLIDAGTSFTTDGLAAAVELDPPLELDPDAELELELDPDAELLLLLPQAASASTQGTAAEATSQLLQLRILLLIS
jgi:hypothetical protein